MHTYAHGRRTALAGLTATLALALVGFAQAAGAVTPGAQSATTTVVTDAASATAGVVTTLTATVTPTPDGGTVGFAGDDGGIYGCTQVPLTNGVATCQATFNGAGSTDVTATYSGDAAFLASTGHLTLDVADRTPDFAGGVSGCTSTTGSIVAVDYGPWGGPIARGCDTASPAHGITLLTDTGFTTAGDQHDGPAFLCRIGSPWFDSGTQYPTPATEACIVTPPAAAYWSYWLAQPGSDTWEYSPLGAYSDVPKPGEVEAWVYGGTNIEGTDGLPTFTPDQVRTSAAGSGMADLASAVHYLTTTDTANGVSGGTTLSGDGYYDAFDDYGDFGLTIDGAFALAATGLDDATLAKVVAFIDDRSKDASGRSIDDWTGIGTAYAGGGSLGKEALLAEATGYDPRDFSGHDLIAALDSVVCAKASTGTDTSCAGPGNYAYATSTFSQALGIMAQLRAGDTANAQRPIAYLEGLQNAQGAWPSLIPSSGDSDVDSTAMAAMALALLPHDATAQAAVTKALAWMAGTQETDGGFPGAAGDSTNSTALALQGLSLAGSTYATQVAKAQAFLANEQNSDGGFNVASDGQQGSDVRASTQVVGGIATTSFGTLLDDIAPPAPPALAAVTPTIKGTAVVGSTLTAATGTWQPAGVHLAYQWLRNGAAIPAATTATYRVAPTDVAQQLSVRVTGTLAGHRSASAASRAVAIAKDAVQLTLRAAKRLPAGRSAKLRLTVKPGISGIAPTGTVTVHYGKKHKAITLTAHTKARLVVTLPRLKAGKYRIYAVYGGSGSYASQTTAVTVVKVTKTGKAAKGHRR
jgi:hypothetical protein